MTNETAMVRATLDIEIRNMICDLEGFIKEADICKGDQRYIRQVLSDIYNKFDLYKLYEHEEYKIPVPVSKSVTVKESAVLQFPSK